MKNINTTIKKLILLAFAVFIAFIAININTNSVKACDYYDCDYSYGYDYGYSYNLYPHQAHYEAIPASISQLGISCYSSPTSASVGTNITWGSSPYGGTGNYYITWTGNDGLSGYGTSISKTYYNTGSKYASVTVTSGNQTASANCGNNVNIYDNYNSNNNYVYPQNNNNNNYNYNYNSPLYVSCSANSTYTSVNSSITWSAYASGGNGGYSYSWNGTESMIGSGSIINMAYRYAGLKSATVTVYSNGQSITQACSNTVNVTDQYNNNYNYNNNVIVNPNTIQVACYADKASARTGSPVTWAVEATGATGNFTYSWSGSESLSGNMASIVKIYDNVGSKTATVSVTSSNGVSATQICGNTVSINDGTVVRNTSTKTTVSTNTTNNNDNSAAALFSLQHVPWGWVAVLIILILIITVIYLIYNRNKI